jgi:hypothetical protein
MGQIFYYANKSFWSAVLGWGKYIITDRVNIDKGGIIWLALEQCD